MTTAPKKNYLLPILGVIAAVAIGGFAYVSLSKAQPAPEVTYQDLAGQIVSTSSLKGKVVIVNFWATSCATCIKEMPQLVDTYRKYKDRGVDLIAVAMKYDAPSYVVNYAQTRQLPFRVVFDAQGTIAQAYGDVSLTPTTFVIDKKGNILKRYVGEPGFAELHQLLEKALVS